MSDFIIDNRQRYVMATVELTSSIPLSVILQFNIFIPDFKIQLSLNLELGLDCLV